jgi:2-phosphosulfolactate phosphatase
MNMASAHHCHLDWGAQGARQAAERGDIVVVVDTLSFSTAVITAVQRGAVVYPCPEDGNACKLARQVGAEVAVPRHRVPVEGKYSLSPETYRAIESGTRIVLPSLNGGGCIQAAEQAPYLFIGALVNATAVAERLSLQMSESGLSTTIVACGEIESNSAGESFLRMAVEDYLGAGAILAALDLGLTTEAHVCREAFRGSRHDLGAIMRGCRSGLDLREQGYGEDVDWAARLDSCPSVPMLTAGLLRHAGR